MNATHDHTHVLEGGEHVQDARRVPKPCQRDVRFDAGWGNPSISRLYRAWEAVEAEIPSRPLLGNRWSTGTGRLFGASRLKIFLF